LFFRSAHFQSIKAMLGCKTSVKIGTKKRVPRSQRAELLFPVGKIHRRLKCSVVSSDKRATSLAAVYVAAVCERLTAKVLRLADANVKELGSQRIYPRDLKVAIEGDEELGFLVEVLAADDCLIPRARQHNSRA
jgi:histone H3/H4